MSDPLVVALALAAASVGALHALLPDHWMPFAAVARARGWSAPRTARITALCGLGHVTVSVALGLLALALGREILETVGRRLEGAAGILLVAFGLVYGLWGLHRHFGRRLPHGHPHRPHDGRRAADPSTVTAWSLFILFSLDPCIAVIPLLLATAPLGALAVLIVAMAYEVATIGTMVALVLPARAGVGLLRYRRLEPYGDAAAGGFIAALGLVFLLTGW